MAAKAQARQLTPQVPAQISFSREGDQVAIKMDDGQTAIVGHIPVHEFERLALAVLAAGAVPLSNTRRFSS